ncbi:MAG: asparagine synthase (glutamine-hydrolyzing) [Candidatus Eiseniibacteriota bacterium]|jgi:asparagine synthase (glutamine-hydrolysing)
MCGIAGIHALGTPRPIDRAALADMNRVITHRGPDSDGFYEDDGWIGMAMRRLAIIDVEGGQQPIANEDGTIWIVFNGEVYNFQELARLLTARGHRFRTRTDTEAIVHAYEEWGTACVERFDGMFCFSLWDSRRRRLLMARDRVGIKQLYYTIAGGQLLWGSELKCLLQHPAVERRLSPSALNHFLTYLYVPAPLTIFEGIHELPAAHRLVVEGGGEPRLERYWELCYAVDRSRSDEEHAAGLRAHLDDAVRARLIADVPLGGFLSGGIDSGSIVALMAAHADGPVRTFSIGYEDGGEAFDERRPARQVAEQYATDHHEFVVRPDLVELVPRLVRAFDQPFADSSAIPNWYLSSMTRRHVTVALSGLGGDEVVAGYERYRGALLAERLGWLPRGLVRGLVAPLVERLPESRGGGHWSGRAKRFVRAMQLDFDDRYLELISAFGAAGRAALLSPAMREQIALDEPRDLFRSHAELVRDADPLHRALFIDLKLYLPGDLLTLTDRMAMAHSLEVRVPFLDHHLLEYAATIPPGLKLRGMERKFILKQAVADLLPPGILNRRKMGFSVPLTVWFRRELRPFVEEVLTESAVRRVGVFDYAAVRRVLDDHFALRANLDNQIWGLITFMLWHRDYIETGAGLEAAVATAGERLGNVS